MDERLREAAESGNVDALYALIQDDADVFRRIDEMEFADTPLHIAAAAGHTDFAIEVMNLKPSFNRKLNQHGFSPIHLALLNERPDMVMDLLSIDKDLARVKGREGFTPLHMAARDGNVHLLSQFLDHCPNCIFDLTIRKETALHIAAKNDRFEAFKAILEWIERTFKFCLFRRRRILNIQDKDGNTILHTAALNSQPQMIELLIKRKEVDRRIINKRGLTASDILQGQTLFDNSEILKLLNRAPSLIWKASRFEAQLTDYIREMTPETINALLVVFALVLTMTYQAILSPPGGADAGKSLLDLSNFLWFYIPNGVAYSMAWIMTMSLLRFVAMNMMPFLLPLYLFMGYCYVDAMVIIAPSTIVGLGCEALILVILIYVSFRKQ